MTNDEVKKLILDECVTRGDFTLSSGMKSDVFVDLNKIVHRDDFRKWFAIAFWDTEAYRLANISSSFTKLIGPPRGANPLISALIDPIDEDGDYDFAEPYVNFQQPRDANHYIIIEDVITTGNSIKLYLDRHGIDKNKILGVICVVDREIDALNPIFPPGESPTRDKYSRFHSFFTLKEILDG